MNSNNFSRTKLFLQNSLRLVCFPISLFVTIDIAIRVNICFGWKSQHDQVHWVHLTSIQFRGSWPWRMSLVQLCPSPSFLKVQNFVMMKFQIQQNSCDWQCDSFATQVHLVVWFNENGLQIVPFFPVRLRSLLMSCVLPVSRKVSCKRQMVGSLGRSRFLPYSASEFGIGFAFLRSFSSIHTKQRT